MEQDTGQSAEAAPGTTAKAGGRGARAARFLFRTGRGRAVLAVALIAVFLGGYVAVSTVPVVTACRADSGAPIMRDFPELPPIGPSGSTTAMDTAVDGIKDLVEQIPTCPCAVALGLPLPSPCDITGETKAMMLWLEDELSDKLASEAVALEHMIADWLVDGMMATMLEVLNQAELNLIDWWDTMWFYNLNPALQDMTKQFSASLADNVRGMQSAMDAQANTAVQAHRHEQEAKARKAYAPSENQAVVATMVGGQQRATAMGIAMQHALQAEAHVTGLNKATLLNGQPNPDATGIAAHMASKRKLYETTFCDPAANNGENTCKAPAGIQQYPNIDTQVTKQIFAKLTIDMIGSSGRPSQTAAADPGFMLGLIQPAFAAPSAPQGPTLQPAVNPAAPNPTIGSNEIPESAVSTILENLVGDPIMNPLPQPVLKGAKGRERYLRRRDYLARYAAVRSVPQMVVGRRMPGSQLGDWVRSLREAAGVPDSEISPNPSYREVLHAMTIDRFTSGDYAVGMITDQTAIEREKLVMNTLYLMQLRDYYELLEREALTLAVQVSMLADEAKLPSERQPQGN